ncbi:hypothetical protein AHAS_Ahas05G0234100 [Arachis hypogaea]
MKLRKKFTEAEAMMRSAESFQAEANRFTGVAERKLRDVEAREDNLRRQIITFKSDCDEKDKEIILERQSLSERQKRIQKKSLRRNVKPFHDEKTNLKLMDATLRQREEVLAKQETELNKKEQELVEFQGKLASRECDEIQKAIAGQEAALKTRKHELETELQMHQKLVQNEIETKRRAWELKEVDLKQRED